MGVAKNVFTKIKDEYTQDVATQKELATELLIGNRGITNFRSSMEQIGIRGGLLNITTDNGYFETNFRKNPVNANYIYFRPEVRDKIEGINTSEISDTLLIGTPYVYKEKPFKNKSNLMLGDIDFMGFIKKGNEKWTIENKQHTSEKISGLLTDFKLKFEAKKFNAKSNSYEEFEDGKTNASRTSTTNNESVSIYSEVPATSANSLLLKTQRLFQEGKINTLINRFQIKDGDDFISRGRNLKRAGEPDRDTGYLNPYCRVWTKLHQYSKLKDRIRPFETDIRKNDNKNWGELRPNNGGNRLSSQSVLGAKGFIKISPSNVVGYDKKEELKKYMFSIENLAWKDFKGTNILSKEQRGPNGGRIMWFPPYNIKFTENINVEWNSNKFIGRGEQIHTYVNTDRSGTLSFTLLIDHPSILNKWNNAQGTDRKAEEIDEDILRFFAGCSDFSDSDFSDNRVEEEENPEPDNPNPNNPNPETLPLSQNPIIKVETVEYNYLVFFPNNYSGVDDNASDIISKLGKYECSTDESVWEEEIHETYGGDSAYESQILQEKNKTNLNLYKLNDFSGASQDIKNTIYQFFDLSEDDNVYSLLNSKTSNIQELSSNIESIEITGYASSHGRAEYNAKLGNNRAKTANRILLEKFSLKDINSEIKNGTIPVTNNDVNSLDAKIARSALVKVKLQKQTTVGNEFGGENGIASGDTEIVASLDLTKKVESETKESNGISVRTYTSEILANQYKYDNEYLYFKEKSEHDGIYVKQITDKVKFFSPAYHSITPEGFNARLTFLNQCTRQGPTYSVTGGNIGKNRSDINKNYLNYAGNLAFGRAPYCVLRIGDFFYTKICIDSISIDYNNGDGIQWDLNPEGAGVQPMMANVQMNFKFLGGQDISGPIERLQNAITANYYANASVYDEHADDENTYFDAWHQVEEKNNGRIEKKKEK